MAATVLKGDKWEYIRREGRFQATGFYTVTFGETDYNSIEEEVFQASFVEGIPEIFSSYPVTNLGFMILNEKRVTPLGSHYFRVDLTYESYHGEHHPKIKNSHGAPVDPDQLETEVSYFTMTSNEKIDELAVYESGKSNRPENSAGEPFDPELTEDYNDMGMRIVKYYKKADYDPHQQLVYNRTVNENTFYGFAKGHVKFVEETADPIEIGTTDYYKVTRTFHCRVTGWKKRGLDQGYRCKKGADGSNIVGGTAALQPIKTKDVTTGELSNVSEPVRLDGAGNILAAGATVDGNGNPLLAGAAVFLEFTTRTEWDYSAFV